MKKILLPVIAVLLSATAFSAANAAPTATTTYKTTNYHSETYYNWNPFSADTTGLYIQGQAGGTFDEGDNFEDDTVYNISLGWQFHPMIRADLEGGYREVGSDVWTMLANGYFDFKNDTRFTPFLGAGAGYAWSNDDAGAFAYQGIAGISFNINNNWALTAQYNYIDTTDFDYSAHEVKGGLRYTF